MGKNKQISSIDQLNLIPDATGNEAFFCFFIQLSIHFFTFGPFGQS